MSEEPRRPLVNQVTSDKVVVAEHIDTLNMGESLLLPPPDQLPPDIRFFSGRESEVAELKLALSREKSVVAICSLWGMGGIGKSALAIHVARELHQAGCFQDGILFTNLGECAVDEALENFIRAFNYQENQIPETLQGKINIYRSILRNKHALVFLDNVQNEEQVAPFLLDGPRVSIIVTSRKNLLALTEYATLIKDLDLFSPEEGVELLKKRIGARYDAESVVAKKICELAGHLPLAISLAASSLADQNKWPILQMFVDRLKDADHRLDTLSGAIPKERGLRAVFQVSYEALNKEQRKNLACLTLFENTNFGSSALLALTGLRKEDAIDQLDEFVNLSLLLRSDLGGYRFHDLLLLFTKEGINEFPESEINLIRSRLDNYLTLLKQARNLGSQASSSVRAGDLDKAIQLYFEVQKINRQLQSRSGQAMTLGGLASALTQKGELDKAIEYYQQDLDLCREIGDRAGQAMTLGGLASALAQKGELDKAIEYYQQAQTLNGEIGNRAGQAMALGGLASALAQKGELDKAIEYYQQDLDLCREIGDRAGQAMTLGGLASALAQKGELDKAIEYYQRAIPIANKGGDLPAIAHLKGGLGSVFSQKGMWVEAIRYQEETLVISRELGDFVAQAQALGGLASAYSKIKQWNKVLEYQEEANTINKKLSDRRGEVKSLGGIAFAYSKLGNLDKSIEYQLLALKMNKENRDQRGQAKSYGALANAYERKGELQTALSYYQKARDINEKLHDSKGDARALGGIGNIYFRQGDWEKAIPFLEKALFLNQKMKDRFVHVTLYQLAVAHEKIGNMLKAKEFILEAYQRSDGTDHLINQLYRALLGDTD